MRAFDVLWGSARGGVIIEDAYVDVEDVVVTHDDSAIHVDGRFSLGFPRRDGGEEINARVRIDRRPVEDLRHAFGLDDYDVDGEFSGEFHVFGGYTAPYGFGTMTHRPTGSPTASRSTGHRERAPGGHRHQLVDIQIDKGGGRGTGAAYVGLNGTYSFNFDARDIPVESLALATALDDAALGPARLHGRRQRHVRGAALRRPRDDSRLLHRDEGIGQVVGTLSIDRELMTLRFEAASPRLAVSGAGRIALTDGMDADLSFTVADTSLDPYVRAFEPRLSPYTTAVASGSVRVVGELANVENLLVDVTVDRLDLRLFDYRLRERGTHPGGARPPRAAHHRHAARRATTRSSTSPAR
jgi:hypothetical protein